MAVVDVGFGMPQAVCDAAATTRAKKRSGRTSVYGGQTNQYRFLIAGGSGKYLGAAHEIEMG